MDTDRILSAVVAVLCILSVGFASTTLDDTIETKPEDVIDIDYDKLPINPQEAEEFKGDNVQTADPDSTATPAEESEKKTAEAQPQPGNGDDQQNKPSDETVEAQNSGSRPKILEESLLDKLLALLMSILPFILIGAVLAVVVKKRKTIAAWLETADRDSTTETTATVVARPDNEVYEAWHEVASVIPYERRKAMTPDEVAAAVRGQVELDDDALMELTQTFKRIRYGGAQLTDVDRDLASRVQEQLRANRVASK
ncbi:MULTISPECIES: DUF4129 domain-containing protein [unclassified Haladaptatus]|uniref:DUF4129 domain-containing protein n=1 Tax=unclassified Haladaptatus TaxID=2622732 RepID=UPI0023E7EE46|nr:MULTISPECIES: DUF4129 domain-containing protein [unclassified Haladaptatus]